jgi:hypothetical protein
LAPGKAVTTIDPELIKYLKNVRDELASVKARTWEKVKAASVRYRTERGECLHIEGLQLIVDGGVNVAAPSAELRARAADDMQICVTDLNALHDAERRLRLLREKYEKLLVGKLEKGGQADVVRAETKMIQLDDSIKGLEDEVKSAVGSATALVTFIFVLCTLSCDVHLCFLHTAHAIFTINIMQLYFDRTPRS